MARIQPNSPSIEYFEDVINKTGWGVYYKFLIGFTSVNYLCLAVPLLGISFGILTSICDTINLDNILAINLCFLIGRAVGGFVLCTIADNSGKKQMITQSYIIIFASSFLAAFSHNASAFYVSAFILGSGLQTNIVCIKINLSEIMPSDKRGFWLIFPDLFLTLGSILLPVASYFMTDSMIKEHRGMDMKLTLWRVIFALSGGLSLSLACASALLEISPRYALLKKRNNLAIVILKQFFAINKSKYSENFTIAPEQISNIIFDYGTNVQGDPNNICDGLMVTVKSMCKMLTLLTKRRFVCILLSLIFIRLSMIFGLNKLTIFLVKNIFKGDNCTISGQELFHLILPVRSSNCSYPASYTTFYKNYFIIFSNVFLGQILSLLIIDRIGRKILLFSGLLVCGISSFILALIRNFMGQMIISSLFITGFSSLESMISVITIECFPTAIRGTVHGMIDLIRFTTASAVIPFLDLPCQNFFIIMGALMLGGSVLAYFIPNLKGLPMTE